MSDHDSRRAIYSPYLTAITIAIVAVVLVARGSSNRLVKVLLRAETTPEISKTAGIRLHDIASLMQLRWTDHAVLDGLAEPVGRIRRLHVALKHWHIRN